MPPPSNISRLTATNIASLPYTFTQDINDAGVSYPVWYKYTPASDQTIRVYVKGDDGMQPWCDIYQDAETDLWLNLGQLQDPINVPLYIPVLTGHTYYFNFYPAGAGIDFSDNGEIDISVTLTPDDPVIGGDFLLNYEVDFDSEYPVAVLSGADDYTVKRYVQVSAPVYPRTDDGLPHGQIGQIFQSGVAVWADEQFDNIKFYNANTLALVATVATDQTPSMAMCRATDVLYTLITDAGVTTIRQYDDTGTEIDSLVASSPITTSAYIGVNSAGTILYHVQSATSRIRRWDLVGNAALSDLVADTAGYECRDLLVLEDDSILCLFFQETTTPRDAYVKQFDPAGATLNTYNFGDLWRSELNPPRIGYALDSPDSFWVRLQPQAYFGLAIYRNIDISSGATITTRNHANFLGGVSLSGVRQGYANTLNTSSTLLAAVAQTVDIKVQVIVNEAFANNGGTQSTFKIGRTGTLDSIAPTATFTDQPEGAGFEYLVTLTAGQDVVVTGTTKVGAGTGRIFVGVYYVDTIDTLGGEKSGALLVVPTSPDTGTISVTKTTYNGDDTSFDFTATGLVPSTFSLAHGETQTFEDVPVGNGYSISEASVQGWSSSATVTNGTLDSIAVATDATTTVAFTNTPLSFPTFSTVRRYPRRLRRTPHVSANGNNVRIKRIQLDMSTGMEEPTDPDAPREIIFRFSKDGGQTWSNERVSSPGAVGEFLARVQWWQVAFGRDLVLEYTTDLPNAIVQGWIDADEQDH